MKWQYRPAAENQGHSSATDLFDISMDGSGDYHIRDKPFHALPLANALVAGKEAIEQRLAPVGRLGYTKHPRQVV